MAGNSVKILGQEPAAIVTGVEAVLAVVLSFGLFDVSNEQAGAIVTVVTAVLGLVVAYATKHTVLSSVTALVKALLMATATWGFTLTDGQQAAVLTVIAVVGGMFLRQTNSAVETAVSNASPGAAAAVHGV